jgi:hypothetical protein
MEGEDKCYAPKAGEEIQNYKESEKSEHLILGNRLLSIAPSKTRPKNTFGLL